MKIRTVLFVLTIISVSTFVFAESDWLSKVSETVNTVNTVVNGDSSLTKTTIKDVKTSGNKYVNRNVEVTGKVVGLAVGPSEGKYIITLADQDGTKINVNISRKPFHDLFDTATAVGTYNGDSLDNGKITH